MKQSYQQLAQDLARRLTRYETEVSVLKPELLDECPALTLLMEDSLKEANERGTLLVPELRFDGNETVGVFSDYGGEHPGSRYITYSVLVLGWNHAYSFLDDIEKIRTAYGINRSTEMSYKSLRYGPLARCLPEYLRACDVVAGMLFTVAIHKSVPSVFGMPDKGTREYLVSTLQEYGFGKRKPKVAEKLLRVVHIAAYLTSWLSCEDQKIFWMSDNDEIVPNSKRALQTIRLFQNVLQIYSSHKFGMVGYATPNLMDDVGRLSDYLSIADLAAGAIEGYLSRQEAAGYVALNSSAEIILNWVGRQGIGLKKHTLIIRPDSKDGLSVAELKIRPEIPEDAVIVPIKRKRI